jgi:hypothetical protein
MSGGEWVTQKERRQLATDAREQARAAKRQLTIEWADKYWLCTNHPADDSVLAWLSEHRSEASKIGASRWNLETLPMLVDKQSQLRKAAAFQEVLDRAKVSHQTLTVEAVLEAGTFPQADSVENSNAAHKQQRPKRQDAGIARKRPKAPVA